MIHSETLMMLLSQTCGHVQDAGDNVYRYFANLSMQWSSGLLFEQQRKDVTTPNQYLRCTFKSGPVRPDLSQSVDDCVFLQIVEKHAHSV